MWVDASEEAYGEFVMSDEYQVVYGDLVNSLMRVRKDMNDLAEQHYQLMNIPTRSRSIRAAPATGAAPRESSPAARDHRAAGTGRAIGQGQTGSGAAEQQGQSTGTGPAADR